MLTQPRMTERRAQPYVAIRRTVRPPIGPAAEAIAPELFDRFERQGIEPVGALLFRYNVFDPDGSMEIDFALPTARLLPLDGTMVAAVLPAGRYATLTHHGHYDGLAGATASLLDWVKAEGLRCDSTATPAGERFAGRFEIYPNDPNDIPDPMDWETEIWIKLAD